MKTVYISIHENSSNLEPILQDYSINEIQLFSVIYRKEGISPKGGLDASAPKYKLISEGYEQYNGELAYIFVFDEKQLFQVE